MKRKENFSSYKSCCMCSKPLPADFEKDFCPACEDDVLFRDVRDYIRTHDVTEFGLAEVFKIPLSKVRKWIKDGRIEYVTENKKIVSMTCQRCGEPISFGSLCPNCLRVVGNGKEISVVSSGKKHDSNRMRYLSEK